MTTRDLLVLCIVRDQQTLRHPQMDELNVPGLGRDFFLRRIAAYKAELATLDKTTGEPK